jgi:hypothetical protein
MIIDSVVTNTIRCDFCKMDYHVVYGKSGRTMDGPKIIPLKFWDTQDLHFCKKECALKYMDSYLDELIKRQR